MAAPASDEDWGKPWVAGSWNGGLSVSAWDGDRCVGHAGAFDLEMAVPGGAVVPMAGVTRVGVLSTHRRQGMLRAMMRRLLDESREQGRSVATLRASEGVIYGRFGFQTAGEVYDLQLDRRSGAAISAPVAPGSMRVLTRAETMATVAAVHARVGLDRPGAVVRPEWAHQLRLEDALGTAKAAYVAVHSAPDGTDDGYVRYSLDWPDPFGEHPGAQMMVGDLWGATPAVELALWKYVLEVDLVDTVLAHGRPPDDPLRFALSNQRHCLTKGRFDEQWVRLLDVDAALTARTYNAGRDAVTVAVSDPWYPANEGVWRVSAEGAERLPRGVADADLATTINGISGAYLGGTSWLELAAIGLVQGSLRSVAAADVLFASRPMPRCGTFF